MKSMQSRRSLVTKICPVRCGIAGLMAGCLSLFAAQVLAQLPRVQGTSTGRATLITFDFPNAQSTFPQAISDDGAITGSYYDAAGVGHGFVRAPMAI